MDESNSRVEQMKNIQEESLELFKKKNQDYGDAFANYGPIGVLVRLGDKISRLQSITKSQITLINSESLRDTLIDLHNYSAMAIMLLDEKKQVTSRPTTPTSPPPPSPTSPILSNSLNLLAPPPTPIEKTRTRTSQEIVDLIKNKSTLQSLLNPNLSKTLNDLYKQ